MRVLSIDWDYFMVINDRWKNCPDGNDSYPDEILNFIWSQYYPAILKNSKLDKVSLKVISKINHSKIPIYVTQNHQEILNHIPLHIKSLDLINIDFHNDYEDLKSKITCGNWVTYLSKHIKNFNYSWIKRPDSDEPKVNYTIKNINSITILDKFVNSFVSCSSDTESWAMIDRYNKQFKELIKITKATKKHLLFIGGKMTELKCKYCNFITERFSKYKRNDEFIEIGWSKLKQHNREYHKDIAVKLFKEKFEPNIYLPKYDATQRFDIY